MSFGQLVNETINLAETARDECMAQVESSSDRPALKQLREHLQNLDDESIYALQTVVYLGRDSSSLDIRSVRAKAQELAKVDVIDGMIEQELSLPDNLAKGLVLLRRVFARDSV